MVTIPPLHSNVRLKVYRGEKAQARQILLFYDTTFDEVNYSTKGRFCELTLLTNEIIFN